MGLLVGRDGNLSIFRVGIIAAVLGAIFIVGGLVLFSLEQSANRQPLEVAVPEGAQLLRTENVVTGRRLYYQTSQTPEEVASFYNNELTNFYKDTADRQICQRFNYEGAVDGSGRVPFEYKCLFSIGSFGIERWTQITIQPGVRNDATGEDFTGSTRIDYEQYWDK